MENLRVVADAAFREEVTSHVDGIDFKTAFEQRYGRRGWQRKLGAVLGVPETTVNGWFKSNKFPALATLAFGVLLKQRSARPLGGGYLSKLGRNMLSAIPAGQSAGSWRTTSPISMTPCCWRRRLNSMRPLVTPSSYSTMRETSWKAGALWPTNSGAGLDAATLARSGKIGEEKREN